MCQQSSYIRLYGFNSWWLLWRFWVSLGSRPLDVSQIRYGGFQLVPFSTSQMSEVQSPPGYLQQTFPVMLTWAVFAVATLAAYSMLTN
jgi:hypothetical protein